MYLEEYNQIIGEGNNEIKANSFSSNDDNDDELENNKTIIIFDRESQSWNYEELTFKLLFDYPNIITENVLFSVLNEFKIQPKENEEFVKLVVENTGTKFQIVVYNDGSWEILGSNGQTLIQQLSDVNPIEFLEDITVENKILKNSHVLTPVNDNEYVEKKYIDDVINGLNFSKSFEELSNYPNFILPLDIFFTVPNFHISGILSVNNLKFMSNGDTFEILNENNNVITFENNEIEFHSNMFDKDDVQIMNKNYIDGRKIIDLNDYPNFECANLKFMSNVLTLESNDGNITEINMSNATNEYKFIIMASNYFGLKNYLDEIVFQINNASSNVEFYKNVNISNGMRLYNSNSSLTPLLNSEYCTKYYVDSKIGGSSSISFKNLTDYITLDANNEPLITLESNNNEVFNFMIRNVYTYNGMNKATALVLEEKNYVGSGDMNVSMNLACDSDNFEYLSYVFNSIGTQSILYETKPIYVDVENVFIDKPFKIDGSIECKNIFISDYTTTTSSNNRVLCEYVGDQRYRLKNEAIPQEPFNMDAIFSYNIWSEPIYITNGEYQDHWYLSEGSRSSNYPGIGLGYNSCLLAGNVNTGSPICEFRQHKYQQETVAYINYWGQFVESSNKNIKDNIKKLEDSNNNFVDVMKKIKIHKFHFKSEKEQTKNNKHLGIIIEDLEENLEDVKYKDYFLEKNGDQTSMDYQELFLLNFHVTEELIGRIESLEKEIQILKNVE